jgi:myo-inositol 2-dehydrogenase/D-chiro-inositol 1-dehydrogenase
LEDIMGKRDRVGIGLVGAGRIGRLHAANLANRIPNARLVAISDVVIDAAKECARQSNIAEAVADYQTLMTNREVDAVVICSSTDTHAQIIEDAAGAGKHIFCEKPIALELASIDRALEAVDRAGVKLQIGFNRRFDPNFRRVWESIRDGKIGKPHILRITSRDPEPPPIEYVKGSGGLFSDMMIHDLDMARYLIGAEVREVFAVGGVLVDPAIGEAGDVDTAIVTLIYENGVLGTVDNCRKAVYGYDQRIEVFGSEGMITADNNTATRTRLTTAEAVMSDVPLHFFIERYTEAYLAEMRAFVDCVAKDIEPPATGADGRISIVLAKAAQLSLETGRVVKVSEIS